MSETYLREKFDELKLTDDEVKRFTEALKKEEFRKLLVEYANEISDPANRKLYEEEIERLENERGVDVTFINPEPGFVLKTTQNGDKKCFINICTNVNIQKPSSEITTKKDATSGFEKKGMQWSIPHSCSPGREDLDKSGKKCIVYDVVFHPDSYRMAETNKRFKQLIQDTAIETIEKNFNVKIDSKNIKILNIKFKGRPTPTVIRKPKNHSDSNNQENLPTNEPQEDLLSKIKSPYKYPPEEKIVESKIKDESKNTNKTDSLLNLNENKYEEPKYTIINRGNVDIQDCVNELKQIVNSTRPKELIIEIDLPLCKSASNVKLDIFEKRLYLESNKPNYKLDLNLSYPVDENNGHAKFDKTKRKLVVTLPVIPLKIEFDDNQTDKKLIETIELTPPSTPPPSSTTENDLEVNHDVDESKIEKPNETETIANDTSVSSTLVIDNDIKYVLPKKYKFEQNSKYLTLKFYVKNFNEKSFSSSTGSTNLTLKFETISSGGYITYYSAYLDFKNSFIDLSSNCKLEYINNYDDNEHILLHYKKLNKICVDKVFISIDTRDQNIMEVDVESCVEEELNNELNDIINEQKVVPKDIKFTIGSSTNERFSVNILKNDELDEDDDEDEIKITEISPNVEVKETKNDRLSNDDKIVDQILNDMATETEVVSKVSESSNESEESGSQSSLRKLKSILKKPRSYSEGETNNELDQFMKSSRSNSGSSSSSSSSSGGSRGSGSASVSVENSLETINENGSRKSVSFNQQIIKNVFRPNQSILDMVKPHTMKNKKRNMRRKRTTSDPSHSSKEKNSNLNGRNRSTSESSEDGTGHHHELLTASSEDDIHEHDLTTGYENVDEEAPKQQIITEIEKQNTSSTIMNEDTMLSWKSKDSCSNQYIEKTKCAFKFTNKIINELDD